MKKLILLVLLSTVSCDSKKSLTKSSDKSQIKESNEASSSTRKQVTQDWSWIGSALESRDGSTRIDFDGPSSIEIRPDQSINATGANARVISTTSSIRQDTITSLGSSTELIQKDTTHTTAKEELRDTKQKEVAKEVKTQKLAPILVLILMIVMAVYFLIQSSPNVK